MYKNAPVMLLDEPTAALDPIAESTLYGNYNQISFQKTTVFVSHRLASTSFCDRIILIENGKICEEGSHNELLKQNGTYRMLFETQAKYYHARIFNLKAVLSWACTGKGCVWIDQFHPALHFRLVYCSDCKRNFITKKIQYNFAFYSRCNVTQLYLFSP